MDCGQRAVLIVTREVAGTSTNVASRRVELVCTQSAGHEGPHRDARAGESWEGEAGKVPTILRQGTGEA